jgi:hypothetical protein
VRRPGWTTCLLTGTAALFALRAVAIRQRSGPVLFADEAGYLGTARLLAGGLPFDMGSSPFYRGGYSLLLAPVARLDLSRAAAYDVVLLVNSALAASVLPLLYVLLRRVLLLPPAAAFGGAAVGALYPSVTAVAQVALSENLLLPGLLLWLLAFAALLRAPTGLAGAARGAAFGACSGALWTVHGRMIVVVALTAACLLALAASRRVPWAAAAAGAATLTCGLVLSRALDALVARESYGGMPAEEIGSTLGRVDGAAAVLAVLRNLLGGIWYLNVATFGLLGVALVGLGVASATRIRQRDAGVPELTTALLLATTLGLLAVSALWFVEPTRPDHLVYGRYVEPVVPALLAIVTARVTTGAASLHLRRTLVVVAALTALVAAGRHRAQFPGELGNRWSVSSLPFFTSDLQPAVLVGAALVGLGGACALARVAARRPALLWLAVLSLFLPVTVFTQLRLVAGDQKTVYADGRWTSPQPLVAASGDAAVGYDTAHFDRTAVKLYQYFLPDTQLLMFDGSAAVSPAALVFSGAAWAAEHPERAWAPLWRDPARDQVLWAAPAG